MTTRLTRQLLGLMVAGAIPAAAWVSTPVVHADADQDARFLALAAQHGMTWGSADAAIRQGHAVCQELYAGKPLMDVASDAFIYTDLTSTDMANAFVAISIVVYCPAFSAGHGEMAA